MKPSLEATGFLPLQGALKQIQFWLSAQRPMQVMLATQTKDDFEKQKLPSHCNVVRRKIQGPRVPVRGRRKRDVANTLAHWPEDGLVEGMLSTLIFVVSGCADIRIADYVVHCQAGDMMYIPARLPKLDGSRPHYETITAEAHCALLMVRSDVLDSQVLGAHICHSFADKHDNQAPGSSCWFKSTFMAQLFAGLGDELQNQGNGKSTFHLLAALILLMSQEIEQGRCFNSLEFPSESISLASYDPIERAKKYIENHLSRSLTIDQVARWVGISRAVFTKQFREATGVSFKTYITELRLEQVKVLLCQSPLSIEHVSERVGLSSGQLRNLFQQTMQCSPSEFRQQSKQSHN